MAIYQFYLEFVPRDGLLKIHGCIPNCLEVKTGDGFFELDTEPYWNVAEIFARKLIQETDKLVNRAQWSSNDTSYNWKTYTKELDNDAFLQVQEINRTIREFSFRADLREPGLVFLKGMIRISQENDFLMIDRNGQLSEPTFEAVKKLILESNAFKFLQDPETYLSNLGNQD